MRIAAIIESEPGVGGGWHQALSAALLLGERLPTAGHEVRFYAKSPAIAAALAAAGIQATAFSQALHRRCLRALRALPWIGPRLTLRGLIPRTGLQCVLDHDDIDLAVILSQSGCYEDIETIPFVATVWDLCHRDHPEFPEVSADGLFALRDEGMRHHLPRATAVLAESESGRAALVRRYGLDPHRVRIFPMLPSRTSANGAPALPLPPGIGDEPFLFYPAQLWPHKNHAYLIAALAGLRAHGRHVRLVLAGSGFDNRPRLERLAVRHGVAEHITWLGYVPDGVVVACYRHALALAMPTWFGPTNIPPLDAWSHRCPVIYSDLPGLRDEVGDAALLCDLASPASLVAAVERLMDEPDLRQGLIERGLVRWAGISPERNWQALDAIITDLTPKLACWREQVALPKVRISRPFS